LNQKNNPYGHGERMNNENEFCIYCEKEIFFEDEKIQVFVGVIAYEHIDCHEKSIN
jgi:hypothetical protein